MHAKISDLRYFGDSGKYFPKIYNWWKIFVNCADFSRVSGKFLRAIAFDLLFDFGVPIPTAASGR
jgi:hypothetical protein